MKRIVDIDDFMLKYPDRFACGVLATAIEESIPYEEGEKIMKDKIKKAVADEFKYRASQGRTNYSMEEVVYIVNEVIDEVFWENRDMSQDQLHNLDMRMGVIKGDLKCLTEKVNKLSSFIDTIRGEGE